GVGDRGVHIDPNHQVGLESSGGRLQDRAHEVFAEPTGVASEHLRRIQEAVGQNDVVAGQRWPKHFVYQLDVARYVQHELGLPAELQVSRIAGEFAEVFGDRRSEATLGAQVLYRPALTRQLGGGSVRDRSLAAAVDAFEH